MMGRHEYFLFFMALVSACGVAIPLILVMHLLMPTAVLKRYWREPHFRRGELVLFTNTIYAPMRTAMLVWVIAFPRFGQKRGISEARSLVPRWYRAAAQVVSVWVLVSVGGVLVLTMAGFIRGYVIGDPVPLTRGR